MVGLPKCSNDEVPVVRLALAKERCVRQKSIIQLASPSAIAEFVAKHYGCQPQENFLGLYFNPRNELLGVQEVSLGALDSTSVDPRVLFAGALLSGAAAVVVVHNHPSGSSEPSGADLQLTNRLRSAAEILSLHLLDHIVVARGGAYVSLRERGVFPT